MFSLINIILRIGLYFFTIYGPASVTIMNQIKKYDLKHIAFHVLAGLYSIWLLLFCILVSMAISTVLNEADSSLRTVYLVWVSLNFIMGTSLFTVIQLFKNKTITNRLIFYTYIAAAIATAFTVIFIMNRG